MSSSPANAIIGVALVETVRAAERLGVLAALDAPVGAAQLASQLSLSERALVFVLDLLAATGYLERTDGGYRRSWTTEHAERLPEVSTFLRTGRTPDEIDRPERRGDYYAKSVLALAELFGDPARELAGMLRPVGRIVDVGAGSAVWSLAMAERTEARVVAVDHPRVLPSAELLAGLLGLKEKLTVVAGDYFEASLDEPADRVVLANVLHLEDEQSAERLVRRWAGMLAPGGELVIVDVLDAPGYERGLFAAAYDLHLGMRTERGAAHDESLLRRWCAAAGLVSQRTVHLGSLGMSALVCSSADVELRARETTTIALDDLRALHERREVAEGRMRMVFDGAADAIAFVDKQGRSILTTNEAFRALFEVGWGAFELRPLEEIVVPGELERVRRIIHGLGSGEITERRHRVQMRRGGGDFTAELTAYDPLSRSVLGFVVRDYDRVARREKLQALGELVGGLTHDLNTPLAVLKANAELTRGLVARVAAGDAEPRHVEALGHTVAHTLAAVDDVSRKLDAIKAFATLERPALESLGPHLRAGLAEAICARAAKDARD